MVHHPCQFAHPQWHIHSDFSPDTSIDTRRRIFGQCADDAVLFIGSHFYAPTAGRVVRDGQAFSFEA
jgi:hypothetical protein